MIFYLSSSISKLIFQEKIRKRFTTVVFVFYAILFLENTVMVSVAIYSEAPRINFLTKIVLPIVFAGFISGALFLMLYYRRYHPSTIKIGNVQSTKTDAHVLRRSKYKEDNIEMEDAEMMNN
jgi:formate/nitrite transporter FocA (FNT family)